MKQQRKKRVPAWKRRAVTEVFLNMLHALGHKRVWKAREKFVRVYPRTAPEIMRAQVNEICDLLGDLYGFVPRGKFTLPTYTGKAFHLRVWGAP